jgi:adenine C2-methylase RlmN of 23S rRNA A2503 and tRNA A37
MRMQGMGEPLSNYDAVRGAVAAMTHPERFGLGRAHVTVSTVGVIPRIRQLAADLPGVSLALSLHAPDQALRASIVPSARAYPLDRLMAAVRDYQAVSRQKVCASAESERLMTLRMFASCERTWDR